MSQDWSRAEVEATVADYLTMFEQELSGVSANKAEHNRHLVALFNNRSRGAVEFKHANISAALIAYFPRSRSFVSVEADHPFRSKPISQID